MHSAEHRQHLHLEDQLALLSALVGSGVVVELACYSTFCYAACILLSMNSICYAACRFASLDSICIWKTIWLSCQPITPLD